MNTFNVIFSHLVLATLKYIFNTVKFTDCLQSECETRM